MAMTSLASLDKYVDGELKKISSNGLNISFYHSEYNPGKGHFTIKGKINSADFEYRHEFGDIVYLHLAKEGDVIQIHTDKGEIYDIQINDRKQHINKKFSIGTCMADALTSIASFARDDAGEELKKEFEKQRNPDKEQEASDALEFGRRAAKAVYAQITAKAPQLCDLMKGYYSRTLPIIENDPDLRTNEEIFEKFGF
jgi:hypothetical protein